MRSEAANAEPSTAPVAGPPARAAPSLRLSAAATPAHCGADGADQRYCLDCGNRRGEPRLPFMDAVVFMDSVKHPGEPRPPPPPPPRRAPAADDHANAALIAGVATLVLAIGVGVLIGRSGDDGSGNAANASRR